MTNHVVHTFIASRVPTERDLHCWFTTQTDKKSIEAKIVRNGRITQLICEQGAIEPKSIKLDKVEFTYKGCSSLKAFDVRSGDIVSISMRICYTMHQRLPGGRNAKCVVRVPFDWKGSIKREYREHFLSYLEQQTGLSGLLDGAAEISIVPVEDTETIQLPESKVRVYATDASKSPKVHFQGAADMSIRTRVQDPQKFARLAFSSIGKRRSYGFGSVRLDGVESHEEPVSKDLDQEATSD